MATEIENAKAQENLALVLVTEVWFCGLERPYVICSAAISAYLSIPRNHANGFAFSPVPLFLQLHTGNVRA